MKVWGITEQDLQDALWMANNKYNGNIIFNRHPVRQGKALTFTLRVADSKGKGARRGFTGRRMVSLCWHGHRDVFKAIYRINPEARITTAQANYKGGADFYYSYPATGEVNIGSMMEPLRFQDACDCEV